MPNKDDKRWFIRPHHLESLTNHYNSLKDDVLNTRYVSHYNQQHGKKEEVNESQLAIEKIEAHLEALKSKQYYMMTQLGEDPDDLEELKHKTEREGLRQYEAFIQDKKRHDAKELLIQAYEDLLTSQRKEEKDALVLLKLRKYLDKENRMKSSDTKNIPKRFEMGTVVDWGEDFRART